MYKKGIDVSKHNGKIDWSKVKAAGIEFAMIRAGYGQSNIDERFKYNVSECNRLGIPCGVYWFSYACNEAQAKKEAEKCLALIKPYSITYPVAFDFEYDSVTYAAKMGVKMTKELASKITHAFCKTIEAAGYYVMNYSNADYLSRFFDTGVHKAYDLWLAKWPKSPNLKNPPDCGIWQYSSTGKVSGINGNVDLNAAYKDYEAIITGSKPQITKPKTEETETEADRAKAWVMKKGISDGTNPKSSATREQVWMMLYRMGGKL